MNPALNAFLWIAAACLLGLFLLRRRGRKAAGTLK